MVSNNARQLVKSGVITSFARFKFFKEKNEKILFIIYKAPSIDKKKSHVRRVQKYFNLFVRKKFNFQLKLLKINLLQRNIKIV